MAFLSKLYGVQVNKAAQLAAHKGIGSMLTYDTYSNFPTPSELCSEKALAGVLGEGDDAIQEYFNYKDTSTRNIYVADDTNVMYRWKHYTLQEWKESRWDTDEDGNYIAPTVPDITEYINEGIDLSNITIEVDGVSKKLNLPEDAALIPDKVAVDGNVLDVWIDSDEKESYLEAVNDYYSSLYPVSDVEDASCGWTYVACAGGGGGGDLTWSKF